MSLLLSQAALREKPPEPSLRQLDWTREENDVSDFDGSQVIETDRFVKFFVDMLFLLLYNKVDRGEDTEPASFRVRPYL